MGTRQTSAFPVIVPATFFASNPASALGAAVSVPSTGSTVSGGVLSVGQLKVTNLDTEAGSTLVVGDGSSITQVPILNWMAANGAWQTAIDVANTPFARDLVLAAKYNVNRTVNDGVINGTTTLTSATAAFVVGDVGQLIRGRGIPFNTTIASRTNGTTVILSQPATLSLSGLYLEIGAAGVTDFVYVAGGGSNPPSLGVNVTPPTGAYALEVSGSDGTTQGAISIRFGTASGKLLNFHDSVPTDRLWVDSNFVMSGLNAGGIGVAVAIKGDQTNNRALARLDKTAAVSYSDRFSGNNMEFWYDTGAVRIWDVDTAGRLNIRQTLSHLGASLGVYGNTPVTRPTVTGSRSANAALASLLAAINSSTGIGLVVDSTTA